MFSLDFKVDVPKLDFNSSNNFNPFETSSTVPTASFETEESKKEVELRGFEAEFDVTLTDLNNELWGISDEKHKKEQTIKMERKEKNENEGKVKELEMQLEVLTKKYARLEAEESKKAESTAAFAEQVKARNAELMANMQEDMEMTEKINEQKKVIIQLKTDIEDKKTQNDSDDQKIEELVAELNDYVKRITVRQKEIISDEDEVRELEEKIEDMKEILEKDKERAEKADDEIEMLESDLKNKEEQIEFKEGQVNDKNAEIEETAQKAIDIETEIAQVQMEYEMKILERENADMELDMVTCEGLTMDEDIAALEELKTAKEEKIVQLEALLEQCDAKYAKIEEYVEIKRQAKFQLREDIRIQIELIGKWQEEGTEDDAQIDQLQQTIADQREKIKAWEAEDAKDEAEIERLTGELANYTEKVTSLTEIIEQLKKEYADVEAVYNEFKIKVNKEYKAEENALTLENYNKYKMYMLDKDTIIKGMAKEADDLQLTFINNTKYSKELKAELDDLRMKYKNIQNGYQTTETNVKDYEGKTVANSRLIDAQLMCSIEANLNVAKFRDAVNKQTGDLIKIIDETTAKLS